LLRHPTFGDYECIHVAQEYFNGGNFGPEVSPYYNMDHVVWLLSSKSKWLPPRIHACLLDGLINWISWPWGRLTGGWDNGGDWISNGQVHERMLKCLKEETRFRWTRRAKEDALCRITIAAEELALPERPGELLKRFENWRVPDKYIAAERHLSTRRTAKPSRKDF
jgi:hypothetical protein